MLEKKLFLLLPLLSMIELTHRTNSTSNEKKLYFSKDESFCFPEDPFYLGPDNTAVNPSVRPYTCNGDFSITVAGFYWSVHQDGMEIAVDNFIRIPPVSPTETEILQLNNLIGANFITFPSSLNLGFKFGFGYNSNFDGWDLKILWTYFQSRASVKKSTHNAEENHTFMPLQSDFAAAAQGPLFAREILAYWKLCLQWMDIALGREFWTSRYITFHPHVGFKLAKLQQKYDLNYRGGSWSPRTNPMQEAFNNHICITNDFKGFGISSGIDTACHVTGGVSLVGAFTSSLVYGRFTIDHLEENRFTISPQTKVPIMRTSNHLRSVKTFVDLSLGIQWATFFGKQCAYFFLSTLTWEQHLFFGQNQIWRVNRIGRVSETLPNNSGENIFQQSRGDLSTQGWTLTFQFAF